MMYGFINILKRITTCLSGRIEKLDTITLTMISLVFNTFTIVWVLFGSFLTGDVSNMEHPLGIKVEKIDVDSIDEMEDEEVGKEEIKDLKSEKETKDLKSEKETKVFLVDFVYDEEIQPTRIVDSFDSSTSSKILDDKIEEKENKISSNDKTTKYSNISQYFDIVTRNKNIIDKTMLDSAVQTLNDDEIIMNSANRALDVSVIDKEIQTTETSENLKGLSDSKSENTVLANPHNEEQSNKPLVQNIVDDKIQEVVDLLRRYLELTQGFREVGLEFDSEGSKDTDIILNEVLSAIGENDYEKAKGLIGGFENFTTFRNKFMENSGFLGTTPKLEEMSEENSGFLGTTPKLENFQSNINTQISSTVSESGNMPVLGDNSFPTLKSTIDTSESSNDSSLSETKSTKSSLETPKSAKDIALPESILDSPISTKNFPLKSNSPGLILNPANTPSNFNKK